MSPDTEKNKGKLMFFHQNQCFFDHLLDRYRKTNDFVILFWTYDLLVGGGSVTILDAVFLGFTSTCIHFLPRTSGENQ